MSSTVRKDLLYFFKRIAATSLREKSYRCFLRIDQYVYFVRRLGDFILRKSCFYYEERPYSLSTMRNDLECLTPMSAGSSDYLSKIKVLKLLEINF